MIMSTEYVREVAHLGHVELYTPKLEESTEFFKAHMGMQEVHREGQSVYLRCWGDYETYSLILTENKYAGVGHTAFRAMSPQALERRSRAVEERGLGIGWIESSFGHGKAYRFRSPDGHLMELYYETQHYEAPDHLKPFYKNQPQKFTGHGAAVKNLDHINFLASNAGENGDFFEQVLNFQLTEQIRMDNGERHGVWYRTTNKSYDVVFTQDHTGAKGRFHHMAFYVESFDHIVRAANYFVDNGVFIEFAPSRHAINQTYFVYVYEPGGNRIEICSGGYMILAPDFKPVTWTEAERKRGQFWFNQTIPSFHTHGTPTIEDYEKYIGKLPEKK